MHAYVQGKQKKKADSVSSSAAGARQGPPITSTTDAGSGGARTGGSRCLTQRCRSLSKGSLAERHATSAALIFTQVKIEQMISDTPVICAD